MKYGSYLGRRGASQLHEGGAALPRPAGAEGVGAVPPLWDGPAAERIAEILLRHGTCSPRRKILSTGGNGPMTVPMERVEDRILAICGHRVMCPISIDVMIYRRYN